MRKIFYTLSMFDRPSPPAGPYLADPQGYLQLWYYYGYTLVKK